VRKWQAKCVGIIEQIETQIEQQKAGGHMRKGASAVGEK